MSLKVVTIPRGGTLPGHMLADKLTIRVVSNLTLPPGETIPETALKEAYQVTVLEEDLPAASPPQAYLIVPCEKGKGRHRIIDCTDAVYTATSESTYKQIPFLLTLDDLQWAVCQSGEQSPRGRRFRATINAWSAVPQAKEAGN